MRNFAFTLALVLFSLSFSFAQLTTGKSDFVGVWELTIPKQKTNDGREFALIHFIKNFNADGSFSNLNLNPETSFVSHKGVYSIDKDVYYETIAQQSQVLSSEGISKSQKFTYRFSEDKQTLYLEGTLLNKDGSPFMLKEAWKRLDIKR